MTKARQFLFILAAWLFATGAMAAEYRLGPGDIVRITVYNNLDLTTEAQVTQSGKITFPLLGEIEIGGLDKASAEARISEGLKKGKFVPNAQVNLLVLQYRSQQVSVLGLVNKPGRYSIDQARNVVDMLALAGGIAPTGADQVTLIRTGADGKAQKRVVDVNGVLLAGDMAQNADVASGDVIYVPRARLFYIYGEVLRPGAYRLEPDMTVMQALSVGGGLTVRGTERGVRVNRRAADGKVESLEVKLSDALQENDVVYVKESLF